MDISLLLQNSLSADPALRKSATSTLERASTENFGVYLQLLASELSNPDSSVQVRMAAGVAFKNTLSSKHDTAKRAQQIQQWSNLDANLKTNIKSLIMNGMAASNQPTSVGTTLAQALAAIAGIELPRNEWPELVPLLLQNVTNVGSPPSLRRSTLESIGFMCEDIDHWVLAPWSSQILTAVVQGARKEELDSSIRLAAISALNNSLLFVSPHFDNETERNYLMMVVCEGTQSLYEPVAVAAYECLVSIMTLYYSYMASYMTHGLFVATIEAMRVPSKPIIMQAIEFWSTVCDTEIDRLIEQTTDPSIQVFGFAKAAAPLVLPMLLELLIKGKEERVADEEGEGDDGDEWTISKAAATSLSLFASCVQDELLTIGNGAVFSFIERNISSKDWAAREAALMAFGSILDGPSPNHTRPYVKGAMDTLHAMALNDSSLAVRDSAAWCISRVCELLCSRSSSSPSSSMVAMMSNASLIESFLDIGKLVSTLESLLSSHPRVAFHASTALMHLGAAMAGDIVDGFPASNLLSPFLQKCFMSLYSASTRSDITDQNTRSVFFQAISALVDGSAKSILGQLEYSFGMVTAALNFDDVMRISETLSNFSMLLQSAFNRLQGQSINIADRAMNIFLSILNSTICTKAVSLHEDVLMAIGALLSQVGEERATSYFLYLFPKLMEVVDGGNRREKTALPPSSLLTVTLGIIGEIFGMIPRELVTTHASDTISTLLSLIQLSLIATIADIVGTLGVEGAIPLLPSIQQMLIEGDAAASSMPRYSTDDIVYISYLRELLLETWTFIVQLAKEAKHPDMVNSIAPHIVKLVHSVSEDDDSSESAVRASIGALGDLGGILTQRGLVAPWMRLFIKEHLRRGTYSESTVSVATWAYQETSSYSHC